MAPVRFALEAGVATVTIDRPEVRNAVDQATAEALAAACDRADERDDVAAIVLTGAGPTFSAGMDLKAFNATGERPLSDRGLFGLVDRPPEKPLVAAVEGRCLGGGFEIALACDLIVAAEDAAFGLPEVRRGLTAAGGGMVRLPRRLPRNLALELLLTGAELPAARAHQLGLVSRLAPSGNTRDAALGLARQIAANAPLAVRASKRIVALAESLPEAEAIAAQAPIVDPVRSSEDAAEGTRAFLERRPPNWRGR